MVILMEVLVGLMMQQELVLLEVKEVLDLEIPKITLPVLAGRNMAVITEAAVRDFMLRMKGYDAATQFMERHSRLLRGQRSPWEGQK